MRLLFLTPQLPFPPHQGTTLRNFNIIKNLAAHHAITLLSFGTDEEMQEAQPVAKLCRRIAVVPPPHRTMAHRAWSTLSSPLPDMALRLESPAMHTLVQQSLASETFDVVQVEGIEMARYILEPDVQVHNAALVFDDHNAEYVLQRTAFESDARRSSRWHAAAYSFIQSFKLKKYERAVCRRVHHIVAASSTDARAIEALGVSAPVSVIPNGVDTSHFVPSEGVCAKPLAELAMVFTGKMDYRPNVDAMLWFCDEILPRIRSEIPLAHLLIVGQKPAPKVSALGNRQGVEVTGWVADIRPYVADAAVYVVPLRMGSGTRLKALEAMAMGKAIVSTARGVEGLDLLPGKHAFTADSPQDFASATVELLRDPGRRRALGREARALVEANYDWGSIVGQFDHIYAKLTSQRQRP